MSEIGFYPSTRERPDYDFAMTMVEVVEREMTEPHQISAYVLLERPPISYRELIIELIKRGHQFSLTHSETVTFSELEDGVVQQLEFKPTNVPSDLTGLRLAASEGELIEDPVEPILQALCGVFKDTERFINRKHGLGVMLIPASVQVAAEAFLAGMGRSELVTAELQKMAESVEVAEAMK